LKILEIFTDEDYLIINYQWILNTPLPNMNSYSFGFRPDSSLQIASFWGAVFMPSPGRSLGLLHDWRSSTYHSSRNWMLYHVWTQQYYAMQ
jgi:hypothetical protein